MTREETKKAILDAYVRHEGNTAAAARELGCTGANVGNHIARLGLNVPYDRTATLANVQRYVADQAFSRTVETRRAAPESVTVAARCHRDRQEFSMGLCRECYRDRRERSMASPVGVAPVDPRVLAELEASTDPASPPAGRKARNVALVVVKPDFPSPRRHRLGESFTAAEFRTLEAIIVAGGDYDEAADALGISPNTVRSQVHDAYEKTGARTLLALFREVGWLRPNYEETMIQEFRRMLEHFDASIHRAMEESRRVAE